MKNWIARLTLLAIVAAMPALPKAQHHHDAPSVTGKWTMTVDTGAHGARDMALTLKQAGKEVTGTFASPHGDMQVKGDFVDGTLTLATAPQEHGSISFNAKLKDEDTLSGYVSTPDGDLTWTAKRAKEKQ
jgi:hypothetical protein